MKLSVLFELVSHSSDAVSFDSFESLIFGVGEFVKRPEPINGMGDDGE